MADTRGVVRLGMPGDSTPTMRELNRHLIKYCTMWKSIGLKLGLQDAVISVIQSNYPMQTEECFREVLQKWLKQDATPTWSTLELAITNVRREELDLDSLQESKPSSDLPKQADHDDKEQLSTKPTSSTSDLLCVNFSSFVVTVRKILEECKDKLEVCKELCSNLTISSNSDVLLFSDDQLAEINQCTSFQQLFTLLRGHWNWKEYSILKGIIAESGSVEAKDELRKFEKLMGSYVGMKLISDEYLPSELLVNYVKLCVAVDQPYKDLSLQQYDELRTFIFDHLDVKKYIALPFIKFLFGSLHLEWYIPLQAVSHVIKASHQNKEVLIQNFITLITVGEKTTLDVKRSSDAKQADVASELPTLPLPIPNTYDHLLCPFCHALFKNPKYLSCHHSYCENCLQKMQMQSKIVCAECRKETVVPTGGVKDLPNNYLTDHLVKKLILNCKMEGKIKVTCEQCKDNDPAVGFCTDCKLFFCLFCEESHKHSKSHSNHSLLSLTELKSNRDLIQSEIKFPTATCHEHDSELEYYCKTCERLVCVLCTVEHEDHKYDLVKKVASIYENELDEITTPIEMMIENLSKTYNAIGKMNTTVKQQGEEIGKEIDLHYEKLINELLNQKEQVKKQVEDTVSQKEEAMTMQLEEVMYIQEKLSNIRKTRDTLQPSSGQEVIFARNHLRSSMKKLTKRYKEIGTGPVESANIKVTPITETIPQVVKHFATIDSLSFEVMDFNNYIQRGQTAMLELTAKDYSGNYHQRGGCKVTAQLESRVGEMLIAEIMDYNDGTYMISFAAQQVGEIVLSVFVNGHEIRGSPFKITVQENIVKPSKIITSHDNSFGQLRGIACSNSGMWVVADWLNNCVHVFDNQDRLIKKFGSRGSKIGEFEYPCGVAFDDHNDLYITDSHNHRVQKFDIHGNYLLQFGGKGVSKGKLKYPIGIATHNDKVYIADRQNNRISIFRNDGKFFSIIGQQHLSQYFDLSLDIYDRLIVADWRHHCIYTFTLDGHCTDTITTKTAGAVQLKAPCSVTTDADGLILIADTCNHCIILFDDEISNCIYCFGSQGSDDGEFNHPHGIAIAPNGNIYVSDTCNKRVQIFSSRLV